MNTLLFPPQLLKPQNASLELEVVSEVAPLICPKLGGLVRSTQVLYTATVQVDVYLPHWFRCPWLLLSSGQEQTAAVFAFSYHTQAGSTPPSAFPLCFLKASSKTLNFIVIQLLKTPESLWLIATWFKLLENSIFNWYTNLYPPYYQSPKFYPSYYLSGTSIQKRL